MTQQMMNLAWATLPDNLELWIEDTSSWMTALLFERLVRRLFDSLRAISDRYRFILVVDALRAHVNDAVAALIHSYGWTLIFIPAKLTWLVQPLDTHYFATLKRWLVQRFAEARLEHPSGELGKLAWLEIVMRTVDQFRGLDFSHGMARCGLRGPQATSAPVTEGFVTRAAVEAVEVRPPRPEELCEYLNYKCTRLYASLMQPLEEDALVATQAMSEEDSQRARRAISAGVGSLIQGRLSGP